MYRHMHANVRANVTGMNYLETMKKNYTDVANKFIISLLLL